jgi:hypothetical protein
MPKREEAATGVCGEDSVEGGCNALQGGIINLRSAPAVLLFL